MKKYLLKIKAVVAASLCCTLLLGVFGVPNALPVLAAGENLVFNGAAEVSDTTPTGWTMISMEANNQSSEAAGNSNRYDKNFTLSIAPGAGVDGSNAIKAEKKSSYGYAAMVSDPISITSGVDYFLSYSYKMTDMTISAAAGYVLPMRVLVWQYDANGKRLTNTTSEALVNNGAGKVTEEIPQWQSIITGFTAVEGAVSCRIHFFMGGMSAQIGFTFWYDNISMTAQPADVLLNGDFEAVLYKTGNTGVTNAFPRPAFWDSITTKSNGEPRTDINSAAYYGMVQVNDGENHETAAKLYVTRAAGGFGGVTYYCDPVDVYATEEYQVSFDLKIAGVLDDDVKNSYGANVMIRYLDKNGNYIGNPSRINSLTRENQEWKSYSYELTIPENAAQMQIGMMIGVANKDRNKDMAYYFDHMKLIRMESLKDPAVTSSELYKKNVLFLGDEIGGGLAQFADGYSEMKVTDNSVAGAGFSGTMDNQISQQAMPAAENFDYVIISGGLFDSLQNVPVGTVNSALEIVGSTNTYAGALETLLMNAVQQYDGLKMAYVFPYQADTELAAYRDAAQAAAQKWNVNFIDLYSDSHLNEEVLKVDTDTYLPDGKILNTQGFEILWKYLIDTLEQLPALDVSQIPGFSAELLLTARYNSIVGAGISPATDVDSLKALGEKAAENGNLQELEGKITAALAEYDTYRPQILGATIAVGDANKLRFMAASPEKVLPANVTVLQQGFLVAPKEVLTEGQIPGLSTTDVMDITAAYSAAGAQYGAYITGMKADPAKQYVAVAYTLYEVDGKQYMLCSINDYENQLGVKTAENGCCTKSVYEIAQDMALYLVQGNDGALDWKFLGGAENKDKIADATEETVPSLHNIFRFAGCNQAILQKMMETEEDTNEA